MAKGKGEKKGGGAADEEQEQKLQAILLADSFNTNFRPISSDMPKVRAQHSLVRYLWYCVSSTWGKRSCARGRTSLALVFRYLFACSCHT